MRRIRGVSTGWVVSIVLGWSQAHAQIYFEERLQSPHPEADSGYGSSIAGGPMGLLVAQPRAAYAGLPSVGAAYLYNAGDPNSPFEFRPSQPIENALYGTSLSNDDDILIGAPGGSADGVDSRGVVEFWHYVPEYLWDRSAFLVPPANELGTRFGQSIATESFKALIGFPGRLDGDRTSGAAMSFDRSTNDWDYDGSYVTPDEGRDFGAAVAGGELRTFIGEPGIANGGGATGAIAYYVNGQPAEVFIPSDGEAQSFGGYSIVPYLNYLFVGVPYPLDADGHALPGRIYVYQALDNFNYTFLQILSAPDGQPGDGFGTSIATYQTEFLVGAPGTQIGGVAGAGAAWMFFAIGFEFTPYTRLVSTFPAENGHFGQSVSLSYGIDIGAPGEPDGDAQGAGAVYHFIVDEDIIFRGAFDFN